jgi:predicted DNA-binding protein
MKKQMHIRASKLTEKQIDELCKELGTTKTGVVALAIERLWQEMKRDAKDKN